MSSVGCDHYVKNKTPLTDRSPLCMYLTSGEMKQVSCRKFSVVLVAGSSPASMHFISMSNRPPKYCSTNELKVEKIIISMLLFFSSKFSTAYFGFSGLAPSTGFSVC